MSSRREFMKGLGILGVGGLISKHVEAEPTVAIPEPTTDAATDEATDEMLKILTQLKESGVPIPLAAWARAGGFEEALKLPRQHGD